MLATEDLVMKPVGSFDRILLHSTKQVGYSCMPGDLVCILTFKRLRLCMDGATITLEGSVLQEACDL